MATPLAQEQRDLIQFSYDLVHSLTTTHPEHIACHRTILVSIFSIAASNLNFSTDEIINLHEKACEWFYTLRI